MRLISVVFFSVTAVVAAASFLSTRLVFIALSFYSERRIARPHSSAKENPGFANTLLFRGDPNETPSHANVVDPVVAAAPLF